MDSSVCLAAIITKGVMPVHQPCNTSADHHLLMATAMVVSLAENGYGLIHFERSTDSL
jgi:hypothetical protein